MQIKTISCDNAELLPSLLTQSLTGAFDPKLAIVFGSQAIDLRSVISILTAKGIQVFGSTTAGEITDQQIAEGSLSIMLIDIPRDWFHIQIADFKELGAAKTVQGLARKAKKAFLNPAVILLVSGLETNGDEVILSILNELGLGTPISGGVAGGEGRREKIEVFSSDHFSSNGVCMLTLDHDKVELISRAASGWLPVGIEKTITSSEGNRVYSIDGVAPMVMYRNYFGLEAGQCSREVIDIGIQYPLQLMRPGKQALLRAPLVGNDEDDSIVFGGSIPEGTKVKLSISPGSEITEQLIRDYSDLPAITGDVDAILLFSCICRHQALGQMIEEEIEEIYKMWKAPMAGFFTYGEIGNLKDDSCAFHNETCVLTILKERK